MKEGKEPDQRKRRALQDVSEEREEARVVGQRGQQVDGEER